MRIWKMAGMMVLIAMLWACQADEKAGTTSTTPHFDFLSHMTLEELDDRIAKKEPMFVYFGWTKEASECIRLQENYIEPNIEYYRWNGLLSVVDLDLEMPKALYDKSLRAPLYEKYNIKYAPALVFFYEGKVNSYIEWSPENNDVETGIPADLLDQWMRSVNLIQ